MYVTHNVSSHSLTLIPPPQDYQTPVVLLIREGKDRFVQNWEGSHPEFLRLVDVSVLYSRRWVPLPVVREGKSWLIYITTVKLSHGSISPVMVGSGSMYRLENFIYRFSVNVRI